MKHIASIIVIVCLLVLAVAMTAAPASAQWVKGYNTKPNPIREYGKMWVKPNPIREYRAGGFHRAC